MTFAVQISTTAVKVTVPINTPVESAYQTRLLSQDGVTELQKTQSDSPSATFPGVAASTSFVGEMSRLDVSGNVIPETVVTFKFDTPADAAPAPTTKQIDGPGALSVSFTQE